MKPPEEIKKGLQEVAKKGSTAFWALETAPYKTIIGDILLAGDALAYIKQLESRLAQVEEERDVMRPAFIKEMKKYGCTTCEHYIPAAYTQECLGCGNSKLKNWTWNGVCAENTEEETK